MPSRRGATQHETTPQHPDITRPRWRKWGVAAGCVALLVGAWAAAGFWGFPRLVRSQAERFVADNYGWQLGLGQVRFNPFKLALEIEDFALPAGEQPMLGFKRLRANLDVSSLWRRGPSFSAIEFEQPMVRLQVERDGSVNLARLAEPFQGEGSREPAGEPARVFIDLLRISDSALEFQDLRRATPFSATLRPVSFELRDFRTRGEGGNAYSLEAMSTEGERFAWRGTFSLAPLASSGSFEIAALRARTPWSYLRDSLPFEISGGMVDLVGGYELALPAEGSQFGIIVREATVTDLGLRPNGADEDYVRLGRLQVTGVSVDVPGSTVSVEQVSLDGGTVTGRREADGRINLLALAPTAPPATNATPAADEARGSAWRISAPDLRVDNLTLDVEDRLVTPAAHFEVAPVRLQVTGFDTAPGTAVDVQAVISVDGSGRVEARGQVWPDEGRVEGHVELAGLALPSLQPYVATYTRMELLDGQLAGALDVILASSGALAVKGNAEVKSLHTVDAALREDFIKWDVLRATGIDYRSEPGRLTIGTLEARRPYVRLIIAPDQTFNVAQVLSAPEPATPINRLVKEDGMRAPTREEPLPMRIGRVRIREGSTHFADFWITPNYAVSIQGLDGEITGLDSERTSRARLALEGRVDRYAPAIIQGEVNLLSASLFTNLHVKLDGVDMTSVTPYSGRFAGYRIERGKLSVDLNYHVEDRQLRADQRFVVDQLQLGERVESEDAIRLPLRLAVALLKDRNGVIDIGLPITGSLDDPEFRIAPIIWKAFVGLLTKVATAPFALLGSLFGGGEEMNIVEFEPGLAVLDPAMQERVAALARAMQERPGLQLDLPPTYSPAVDGPVLAETRLRAELLRQATQLPQGTRKRSAPAPDPQALLADPAQRFEILAALFRARHGADAALPPLARQLVEVRASRRTPDALDAANEELEAVLREGTEAPAAELDELGRKRAEAIQDVLIDAGGVDPARVFLLSPVAQEPVDGKVQLQLGLR